MAEFPATMSQRDGLAPRPSSMDAMSALLARNWWALAVRAAAAVLFGLVALLLPFAAITTLVLLFGAYMLVDGAFAIAAGVLSAARHERWGLLILEGVVDLIAGVVAIVLPGLTVLVIVVLLGVWSVVTGALMLAAAFRLHGSHGRWLLAVSGLLSIAWGVLLYLWPVAGTLVLAWWLGGYSLVFGILLLALAFRLRARRDAMPHL